MLACTLAFLNKYQPIKAGPSPNIFELFLVVDSLQEESTGTNSDSIVFLELLYVFFFNYS